MDDKPRLIEVAFPLKQASLASVHEKNVRHGHISTLHIWPARRPLAACRAALLATLIPDPGDPKLRDALLEKIGGKVVIKNVEVTDDEGNSYHEEKEVVEGGVLAWGQEDSKDMDELRAMILKANGGKPPKVLDPFAGGGAIPLEAMRLGCEVTASDINPVAWFILKCTLDYPQQFAGKKWPLPDFVNNWPDFIEDFKKGKVRKRRKKESSAASVDSTQLDHNIDDPKLPEADLAWHVRAWGRWVLERARADLAARYPVVNGEPTVAYLWARTARDKMTAGTVPLLKTFWLCKKRGKRAALLPVPKSDKSGVDFKLLQERDIQNPGNVLNDNPFLRNWEVDEKNFEEFVRNGTMNRTGVWSPCSGRPGLIALTMEDLRLQGQRKMLGTQMTAVVVEAVSENGKKTFKRYRLPVGEEIKAAQVEIEELEEAFREVPFGTPEEAMPVAGTLGFRVPLYGFREWRDVFTDRQILSLGVFCTHVRSAVKAMASRDMDASIAIGQYLAVCLDRLADYSSSLCTWHNSKEQMRNTFGRFALPIVWDFTEVSPVSSSSGNFNGALEWVCLYVSHALSACRASPLVNVQKNSAVNSRCDNLQLILTDPPYYDAIPYSDLMDFFYVWLRRCMNGFSEDIDKNLSDPLSPKWDHSANDGELIDDQSRFEGNKAASKQAYENGMQNAFQRSFDLLSESGRMAIVFANKEVIAWETLVGAMIKSGAIVTASWPVQTEMPNRTRGISSAALSSSVWIVCRKRPDTAIPGWDEQVLARMKQILFDPRDVLGKRNILQYFFDLGIRGPDFIWAALGPALEAYSAHPFVKKTEGGIMTVPEFLAEVRRLVLQFSLGELPGFKEIQQETQGRGESFEIDPVTQYYLLHRNFFALDPAPAGACILYANACGKNETELKVVWNILEQGGTSKRGRPRDTEDGDEGDAEQSKGNEYRLLRWEERAASEHLGESKGGVPSPLIDKLHRMMFLFKQNRASDVQVAFDAWGLVNERAFVPLLQAVRELAVRDKDETERRLVEALATQLRMNRKTLTNGDRVQELPLFEYDSKRDGTMVN